jgi:transposase-like protein
VPKPTQAASSFSGRAKHEKVAPCGHLFVFDGRKRIPISPPGRRIIYTTNAIESLHSGVRKSIRSKGHFPSDQAATKLIWPPLRNITAKWKHPPIAWVAAKAQFAIQFGERFRLDD